MHVSLLSENVDASDYTNVTYLKPVGDSYVKDQSDEKYFTANYVSLNEWFAWSGEVTLGPEMTEISQCYWQ